MEIPFFQKNPPKTVISRRNMQPKLQDGDIKVKRRIHVGVKTI
jgi:hypothetical protein